MQRDREDMLVPVGVLVSCFVYQPLKLFNE